MLREYPENFLPRETLKSYPAPYPSRETAANAMSRGRQPRRDSFEGREGSHSRRGSRGLHDIESLLMESGLSPAQVLQYSPTPLGKESSTYRDPTCLDIPPSLAMLNEGWDPSVAHDRGHVWQHHDVEREQHRQQEQLQSQYIWRLEQELSELTEQQAATCTLLFNVTMQKDVAELVAKEVLHRHSILQDAEGGLSAIQAFSHERKLMLREALWRGRLEKESLRAAVAEERLRTRDRELAEERANAARAASATAAELAALRHSLQHPPPPPVDSTAQMATLLRSLLAESNDRVTVLLDAMPQRVRTALHESAASSPTATPRGTEGGAPSPLTISPTGDTQLQDEIRAMLTSVLQEQLAAPKAADRSAVSALRASASSPPTSPVAQKLSAQHQSLLFNKVVHILDSVESAFAKASFDKSAMVMSAFSQQVAVHERALEARWRTLVEGKRAEVKGLREALLSAKTQQQQWKLVSAAAATEGSLRSLRGHSLSHGREGSAASFGAASASSQAALTNPVYEPYVVPYIPPALKETKPPVKQSLKKLTEEALRLGARPATDLMPAAASLGAKRSGKEPSSGTAVRRLSRSPSVTSLSSETSWRGSSGTDKAARNFQGTTEKVVPTGSAKVIVPPTAQLNAGARLSSPPLGATNMQTASLNQSVVSTGLAVKSFQRQSSSSSSSSSSLSSTSSSSPSAVVAARPEAAVNEDGPVKVTVAVQRVATVGKSSHQHTRAHGDEDDSSLGSSSQGEPPVIESAMTSRPEPVSTVPDVKERRAKRSSFDDSASSSSSTEPPTRTREKPTGKEVQRESVGMTAPAPAPAVKKGPTPLPVVAASAAPTPAKKGLQALESLLQSSSKPATVKQTAPAKTAPLTVKKAPPKERDTDEDSLSLTLTTASSASDAGSGKRGSAAAKKKNTRAASPTSAKKSSSGAAKLHQSFSSDTSSTSSGAASPAHGAKRTDTAPAAAPTVRRSAFDDDDDDDSAKPAPVTISKANVRTVPVDSRKPQAVTAPTAKTSSVVQPAPLGASVAAKKKTVALPW